MSSYNKQTLQHGAKCRCRLHLRSEGFLIFAFLQVLPGLRTPGPIRKPSPPACSQTRRTGHRCLKLPKVPARNLKCILGQDFGVSATSALLHYSCVTLGCSEVLLDHVVLRVQHLFQALTRDVALGLHTVVLAASVSKKQA